MESSKTAEKRSLIEKEAEYIVQYVRGFKVCSIKDESAIEEILAALNNLHATVDRIEEAHQRRIILISEMAKTISAMEEDHKQFASMHKKTTAD